MTILEVIQRSAEFLTKKGVDSPRLQVELLLAHVLKMPRMQLYLNFEKALSEPDLDTLREMVRRRAQREPLQYILGSVSFCGLELAVNKNVLVPRPETELLAGRAWNFLARQETANPPRAWDLGTGSGCLAIALAVHAPAARIDATDLSTGALAVAEENAARHQVSKRIQFQQRDGFAGLEMSPHYNLIVSNPPYIPSADIANLEPEVRDFEPRGALDGGVDGMDFYHKIAREAGPFLKPQGRVMLELNDVGSARVEEIFRAAGWEVEAVELDHNKFARIFVAHRASEIHDGACQSGAH